MFSQQTAALGGQAVQPEDVHIPAAPLLQAAITSAAPEK
jgi:hypothetical protein